MCWLLYLSHISEQVKCSDTAHDIAKDLLVSRREPKATGATH